MAKKLAIGLDIGGTALRAAEVSSDAKGTKVELQRYAEIPLPLNAVRDGEVMDAATVVQGLKALWAKGGFTSKDVIMGVGNQRVAVRPLTMPQLPMEQLQAALPFQVQDLLPMPVEEALLGYYPTTSISGADGSPAFDGMLVAAARETVLTNLQVVEAAGLNPVVIDLAGFALLRIMARGALSGGTVAFVDIGSRGTSVVVATDGMPKFVRNIPNGAQDLTDSFARATGISLEEAFQVLRTRGLAATDAAEYQGAAGPFGGTVRTLVDGIRNSIAFYASTTPGAPVTTVVLSGGGAFVPGLGQAIASTTRMRTVLGNPLEGVQVSKQVREADALRGREATLAMTIGLGMGVAA
ncbi:type IV pilus assembly protein PilM [Demequina sp.]|uniref:type IV pilus assembly protein PilM n=1 Tax=Demequina sp. TaxID=2050685 RepID=UPI003D1466B0